MNTLEHRKDIQRAQDGPVTVVGAGPAGLACAIALARAGRSVVVREWHADVGARFHGDHQGLENWSDEQDVLDELRAAGIEISFDHHAASSGIAFDGLGQRYPLYSSTPLYYLVRRGKGEGTLDRALLQQARAAGSHVPLGARAGHADGPTVLAAGPRRADAIAVGYVFETGMPDGSWLALDNRLAPFGYAYLLVNGGRGTVASCMFTGFKMQAESVERTIAFFEEHAGLEMREPRPFGGFANFRLPRTALQGGHPVVGEQAGFQDSLAGFGLRYALRSGLLAARSILDGTDYTRLWRRDLLPLLRTGVVNRFLFNTIGDRGKRLALRRLSDGDVRLSLRHFYQHWVLSRLLFPIARFSYRAPLRDQSCNHENCHCVWCQCQAEQIVPAITY